VIRLVAVALVWGFSFLFIKVLVEGAPPVFVAWGRVVLGAAVLLPYLYLAGQRLPGRGRWGQIAVQGMLMTALPFTLIAWGETRIASALASVLNASTPMFTAAAAAWMLRERLRPPQLAGLVLGLVGVGVVAGVGGSDLAASSLAGSLAILGASCCYGLGFAWASRHLTDLSATQLTIAPSLVTVVVLAPLAGLAVAVDGLELTWVGVLCLVLLGCLGTGLALLLNYQVLKELGPTTASLVTYLVPVVGVTAGVLLLDEPFSFRLVIGGALIVLSVALVQGMLLGGRKRAAPARESSG
jgi:drug/metabolite transporter (DMT)-like permease